MTAGPMPLSWTGAHGGSPDLRWLEQATRAAGRAGLESRYPSLGGSTVRSARAVGADERRIAATILDGADELDADLRNLGCTVSAVPKRQP
jgi:hypothetical protein